MPFVSKSQSRFMFATNPKLAREFADKTPSIKALPEHIKKANLDEEFKKIAEALKKLPPVPMREISDMNSKAALDQKMKGDPIAHRNATALRR